MNDEDYPAAVALIREHLAGDQEASDEEVACGGCGESNPGNFDLCWSCGEALPQPQAGAGVS